MSNSGFFSYSSPQIIAVRYAFVRHTMGKRLIVAGLAALLLVSVASISTGCAAAKCDCPKFGGHHLQH